MGVSSLAASVPSAPHTPVGSFHSFGTVNRSDKTPVHFPSLGYDLDSYFTDFPGFGFFNFNPDRAGVTTRTHLPPFPVFPEDIAIKGGKDAHHAPRHPSKDVVTQLIHDKSHSIGPKHFRSRVTRRARVFPLPPAMPTYPKPRAYRVFPAPPAMPTYPKPRTPSFS